MPTTTRPTRPERGLPITALEMRRITDAIVHRLTVVGGRVTRIGPNISIDIDPPAGGSGGIGKVFPVTVAHDGGSDGSSTTAASWTYTVSDYETGEEIDTGVEQQRPRPNGKMLYQQTVNGDPMVGMAYYGRDNTLILWDAGEHPLTGVCT